MAAHQHPLLTRTNRNSSSSRGAASTKVMMLCTSSCSKGLKTSSNCMWYPDQLVLQKQQQEH